MYGRNNNNIFNRTTSNNNTSSTNIFSRSNNSNTSNNLFSNNNNGGYNNSTAMNRRLGTNRVPDYTPNTCPRYMEDINPKWKQNDLNPVSISVRHQTMHLVPVELRLEDYYFIRTNKMQRDLQRMVKDAIDKGAFNQDLLNPHVVVKEPDTFKEGPPSLDMLKQVNKNRVLHGSQQGSSSQPYSSNIFSNNNSSGNNGIFNRSNNNIFSNNNNSNNYNNNSSNIFSSTNNNNRNIFGNNNSSNNNSWTNNSSSNNIFNRHNNTSNNNNIFGNNSANNNTSNNIFANNNNNNYNSNNNNNNNRNIFGNQNSSSSNIFGNNSNNNNNNRNIFGNSNQNNSSNNNIFNNNSNNNNSNRNIFGNSSNNNIFSNNNSLHNNNNNRNLFNNNNNNTGNNNIFSNQNNNNNSSNNNNQNLSTIAEFTIMKMLQTNASMVAMLVEQNRNMINGKLNHSNNSYNPDVSPNNSTQNQGNPIGLNNISNNLGLYPTKNPYYDQKPKKPAPFDNYYFNEIPEPLFTPNYHSSINPIPSTSLVMINGKQYLEDDRPYQPTHMFKKTDQSQIIHPSSRPNQAQSIYKTKSDYVQQEEIQMKQISRGPPKRQQNSQQSPNQLNADQTLRYEQNIQNRKSEMRTQSMMHKQSTLSQRSRRINLPEGYIYKPKNFEGDIVENLQITNEYGTVRWPGKVNLKNVVFTEDNFRILPDKVQCDIPELDQECFVTFFTIPSELMDLPQTQAAQILSEYLKNNTNGNIELQMFCLNPQEYRLKIKTFKFQTVPQDQLAQREDQQNDSQ